MRNAWRIGLFCFLLSCNTISTGDQLAKGDIARIKNLHLLDDGEQILKFYSEYKKEVAGNFFTDRRIAAYWLDEKDHSNDRSNSAYYTDIKMIDTVYNAGLAFSPYMLITKNDGSTFKVSANGKRNEVSSFFVQALSQWHSVKQGTVSFGNQSPKVANADSISSFNARFRFNDFKTGVYGGKLAGPDFRDNKFAADKEYVDFIRAGCQRIGINFGGCYTILEKSCGAMCESFFVINRKSGEIYVSSNPTDGRYGYLFHADSKLMIANANSFTDPSMKQFVKIFGEPELYVWEGKNFRRYN